MLYPYPTDFPTDAIDILLADVEGKPAPMATNVHALANVVYYGLGKVEPDAAANATPITSHAQAVLHLKANAVDPSKINWGGVLKVLLPVLTQLLPVLLGGLGGAAGA